MPIWAAPEDPSPRSTSATTPTAGSSGRFRWLLSTCLAGAVGVLAILVVIAGSMDTQDGAGGCIAGIEDRLRNAPLALRRPAAARSTACAGPCPRPTNW